MNHENDGYERCFLSDFDSLKKCGSSKKWRAQEFCDGKCEKEGAVEKVPKALFYKG